MLIRACTHAPSGEGYDTITSCSWEGGRCTRAQETLDAIGLLGWLPVGHVLEAHATAQAHNTARSVAATYTIPSLHNCEVYGTISK